MTFVQAKQPTIVAFIDSSQIMIGEQTLLRLEITIDKKSKVQLPVYHDTLVKGIEILHVSQFDTVDIGDNYIQIKYNYLITAFDSALYLIPPFRLIARKDTFYSNELTLKVSSPAINPVAAKFYDIKDVFNPRLVLADYIDILFYTLGICILVLVISIFIRRKKQKSNFPFKQERDVISPHIYAIQALDKIKEQELWQQGKDKEYHSQISNIIRIYIIERFYVNVMEMTSGETLQNVKKIPEINTVFNNLKQILLLADLVKFAKYHPLAEENELSITNAYLFVNTTMPIIKKENI